MQFRPRRGAGPGGAMADFHGAKAAILIGERLLTILRDDVPHIDWPGWWDLPGGGREGEELPEETILREISEEVGLTLTPGSLGWRRPFPSITKAGSVSWFFVIELAAEAEADIVFGDEGQGWRLVEPGSFLEDQQAIPYLKERLRVWLAEREGPSGPG